MEKTNKHKIKPKPKQEDIDTLANALNVDSLVAQLLLQRGISTFEEAKHFFRPQLSDLHDPFLMKDMDKAVERIELALQRKENVLVEQDKRGQRERRRRTDRRKVSDRPQN